MEPRNDDNLLWWLLAFFGVVVLIIAFILGLVGVGMRSKFQGENLVFSGAQNVQNSGGSNAIVCSGVANVPAQYMPWVKDAASKWLGGDEAALIALIQIESSWNPIATPGPGSSAGGLGQFLTSTARSMPEFSGGADGKGKTWPPGTLYSSPGGHSDDARFDPQRAIYATAHYMNKGGSPGKSLGEMYEKFYHGGRTPKQIAEAKAGRARLERVYAQIKSKNCTEVASSGGGSSATGGDYAPPVPSATLKKLIPLGVHHHSEVAADIPVPTGTPVYAFTNGTIATVFRSTTHIPYAGASGAGISGACGTGLQMRATDGNTYTYCHMSSLNSTIEKGATLKAGDSIGLSGNTGYTEGPHLHLGAHGAITAAELRSRIESTVK